MEKITETEKVETAGTTDVKKKLESAIEIIEPVAFDESQSIKLITSNDFIGLVNSVLRAVFSDYVGATMFINDSSAKRMDYMSAAGLGPDGLAPNVPFGALYMNLYFKNRPEVDDMYKSLISLQAARSSSLGDKIRITQGGNMGRHFDIDEVTKFSLKDFTIMPVNNWNNLITEVVEPNPYNSTNYDICVKITGISVDKFAKAMFGEKGAEGEIYQYMVSPLNLTNMGRQTTDAPQAIQNFLLGIVRMNGKSINTMTNRLGIANSYITPYISAV